MDTATEKPTPRQRHRLRQLLLSSVFTAEEAHRASVWLASPAATKDRANDTPLDYSNSIDFDAPMVRREFPHIQPIKKEKT